MKKNIKPEKSKLLLTIFGVSILIATVAGSTFAYFVASATTTGTPISGETLNVDLSVTATRVSKGTGKLIPIYDGTISGHASQLATAANSTYDCVDTKGNTVCQIYEIQIINGGEDDTSVNIELNLTGSENIKWATMTDRDTVSTVYEQTNTSVAVNQTVPAKSGSTNGTLSKYIMVYLMNTGTNQTGDDGGESFGGTVKITATSGEFIQATF